jgi:hypothetical protein
MIYILPRQGYARLLLFGLSKGMSSFFPQRRGGAEFILECGGKWYSVRRRF